MNWTDYEDFQRKYDSTVNPENYAIRMYVWNYYESIGYMLHHKLLDLESIYTVLNGYGILTIWNKLCP